MLSTFFLSAFLLTPGSCLQTLPTINSLNQALEQFVDKQGQVDYAAIHKSQTPVFASYLDDVRAMCKETFESLDRDTQAALVLNFYNVWVIEFMSGGDGKPGSILKARVKGRSIFDAPIIRVVWYPRALSLNDLEKRVLKGIVKDPRFHMALVCGAKSCPKLRRSLFTGQQLNEELDAEVQRFLNDPLRNQLDTDPWRLSKIFQWYREDFGTTDQAIVDWVIAHRRRPSSVPKKLEFLDYDWAPNTQH